MQKLPKRDLSKSNAQFKRAVKRLPLGVASTFRYWGDDRTIYVHHGKGGRTWDIDGNAYVDYRLGYGPAILGYADDRVDAAARRGMEVGGVFALSTERELAVAEGNYLTRSLTNLPPNQLTPGAYRKRIAKLAKDYGWKLEEFGFDKLKIDRSFIVNAAKNVPEALAIVRAVVALADSLGMATTAEGVETADDFTRMRDLGVNQIQGYLFGRPMEVELLEVMIGGVQPI